MRNVWTAYPFIHPSWSIHFIYSQGIVAISQRWNPITPLPPIRNSICRKESEFLWVEINSQVVFTSSSYNKAFTIHLFSFVFYLLLGRIKPPKRNTRSSTRAPPVFAMIMVLQTPEMSLKIPAAICWTRNISINCLKNLRNSTEYNLISQFS